MVLTYPLQVNTLFTEHAPNSQRTLHGCGALFHAGPGRLQLTGANVTHLHSRLGRLTRSSSLQPLRCHTRMQPREQVANTSPYSWGKARPLILSEWAVCTVCSSNLQQQQQRQQHVDPPRVQTSTPCVLPCVSSWLMHTGQTACAWLGGCRGGTHASHGLLPGLDPFASCSAGWPMEPRLAGAEPQQ